MANERREGTKEGNTMEETNKTVSAPKGAGTVKVIGKMKRKEMQKLRDSKYAVKVEDSSPENQTLEEHDRRHHPDGYKEGDTCKFREKVKTETETDQADVLSPNNPPQTQNQEKAEESREKGEEESEAEKPLKLRVPTEEEKDTNSEVVEEVEEEAAETTPPQEEENSEKGIEVAGEESDLTPEDKEYIEAIKNGDMDKAEKMVREAAKAAGYTISAYHGTNTGKFTVFDKDKASPEGDMGAGFYLTSDEDDVSRNYEGGGPDWDNKVALLAERLQYEEDIDDYDEAKKVAEERLKGENGGSHLIEAYVKMENPAYVDGTTLMSDIGEELDIDEFESEDDYFEAKEQAISEALEPVIEAVEALGYDGTDDVGSILTEAAYNDGITIPDLKEAMKDVYAEDAEGRPVNNEVIRTIVEALGYDGIIDSTVSEKFKNMNLDYDTTHYIAFSPNQIKSSEAITKDDDGKIIPLSQRFKESEDDIRYSKSVEVSNPDGGDNESAYGDEEELTPEDKEYLEAVNSGDMETVQRMVREAAAKAMPNTKVVGEDGLPLIVYHNTNERNISKFEVPWEGPIEWAGLPGVFFATKPLDAYGRISYPVFLNIENPMDMNAGDGGYLHNRSEAKIDKFTEQYERAIKENNSEFSFGDDGVLHITERGLNALENDGYYGDMGDGVREYAALSPSQIKSADPVTYDDKGNVIPLSKRFNNKEDDIRYSKTTKPKEEGTDKGFGEEFWGSREGKRIKGYARKYGAAIDEEKQSAQNGYAANFNESGKYKMPLADGKFSKDFLKRVRGEDVWDKKDREEAEAAGKLLNNLLGNVTIEFSDKPYDGGNKDSRKAISGIYSGSIADFEAPSLNYVGGGEGTQVYGWGLYGSTLKNDAEYYAAKAQSNYVPGRGDGVQRVYEQTYFTNRPDGDESHLLNWYEPVSAENKKRIDDALISVSGNPMDWEGVETGEDVYRKLANFASPEEASRFLAEMADIDGVKYPAEDHHGRQIGDAEGWNYVTFRDDNIRVDHKWENGEQRFFKDKSGKVVGEYDRKTGKITLYPGAKVKDVVHEYAHGLWQFAEQEAKEGRTTLRDKFHKIAKSAPTAVKKAVGEAYKLQGPSVIMEECFTHELARKSEQNQEFAKAIKTASGKSWYNRAWRTIKDTWGGIARKMGYGKADIDKMENMNAHESAEYILKQMAQGKHFGDIDPTPDGSGKRKSISGIYTGSAADYDKPSLLKVGTGEGNQVYGWGLYGSNRREVAEGYAEMEVGKHEYSYQKNGEIINEREDTIESKVVGALKLWGDVETAIEELKGIPNSEAMIKELKEHGSEYKEYNPQKHIYEQTFFTNREKGDESHLLKWYSSERPRTLLKKIRSNLTEEQANTFNKMYNKAYRSGPGGSAQAVFNQDIYEMLTDILGSQKDATEFLRDKCDIDGIKYPVDSYSGPIRDGDKDGWNYVSFRDDNIKVDRKWKDGEEVSIDNGKVRLPNGKEIDKSLESLYKGENGKLQNTKYSPFLKKMKGDGSISTQLDSTLDNLFSGKDVSDEDIEATPEWKEAHQRADAIEDKIEKEYGVRSTHEINTPERKQMRRNILKAALTPTITKTVPVEGLGVDFETNEGLEDGESYDVEKGKKVFLTIGFPAAGKSTTFANPLARKYKARLCDSDTIKKVLPEFANGYGGNAVHEESSALNEAILRESVKRGENIVYPILGYDGEKLKKTIKNFKDKGYKVGLCYKDMPIHMARGRLLNRFLQKGRYLPLKCISKAEQGLKTSFDEVKDMADTYVRTTNDSAYGGKERVIESKGEILDFE